MRIQLVSAQSPFAHRGFLAVKLNVFERIHGHLTKEEKANCKQFIFIQRTLQPIKIMPLFITALLISDFHHYRNHYKCKVSKRMATRKAKGCKLTFKMYIPY